MEVFFDIVIVVLALCTITAVSIFSGMELRGILATPLGDSVKVLKEKKDKCVQYISSYIFLIFLFVAFAVFGVIYDSPNLFLVSIVFCALSYLVNHYSKKAKKDYSMYMLGFALESTEAYIENVVNETPTDDMKEVAAGAKIFTDKDVFMLHYLLNPQDSTISPPEIKDYMGAEYGVNIRDKYSSVFDYMENHGGTLSEILSRESSEESEGDNTLSANMDGSESAGSHRIHAGDTEDYEDYILGIKKDREQ